MKKKENYIYILLQYSHSHGRTLTTHNLGIISNIILCHCVRECMHDNMIQKVTYRNSCENIISSMGTKSRIMKAAIESRIRRKRFGNGLHIYMEYQT